MGSGSSRWGRPGGVVLVRSVGRFCFRVGAVALALPLCRCRPAPWERGGGAHLPASVLACPPPLPLPARCCGAVVLAVSLAPPLACSPCLPGPARCPAPPCLARSCGGAFAPPWPLVVRGAWWAGAVLGCAWRVRAGLWARVCGRRGEGRDGPWPGAVALPFPLWGRSSGGALLPQGGVRRSASLSCCELLNDVVDMNLNIGWLFAFAFGHSPIMIMGQSAAQVWAVRPQPLRDLLDPPTHPSKRPVVDWPMGQSLRATQEAMASVPQHGRSMDRPCTDDGPCHFMSRSRPMSSVGRWPFACTVRWDCRRPARWRSPASKLRVGGKLHCQSVRWHRRSKAAARRSSGVWLPPGGSHTGNEVSWGGRVYCEGPGPS